MPIAYAAHTQSCTFFLDDDGVCRQIVRRATSLPPTMKEIARGKEDTAGRCIGAQYVATIDVGAEGLLAAMPKVGAPMLFAYVGEGGKIALVRTGKLVKFEAKSSGSSAPPPATEKGKRDSGVRQLPEDDSDDEIDENARTQRFFARTHMPFYRPTPLPAGADRKTPIPTPVRRVTIVPPSNNSAPTLPRTDPKPARGRGILPARRRG